MEKESNEDIEERKRAYHREAVPHLDALFATAIRLTKERHEAEDLVQETMLKAYRYFHRYEQGTNCKAWLFRILMNTFINRYRRTQRRKESLVDDSNGRSLQELAVAEEPNPLGTRYETDKDLFFVVFGDEVRRALEEVPVDFRMVVLLADLQDFAYKEIAEIMGCPIGTVMSRLYRGRRMLQERLFEYARKEGYLERSDAVTDLQAYRSMRAEG
jgi:RNA polymerase sigma-70 factor, ECF subfamily